MKCCRKRIVNKPEIIPPTVEAMLQAYAIVRTARKALHDMEFHRGQAKAGDMAVFALALANRDDRMFAEGTQVNLDRGITRHITFGAGPHRCLGSATCS